MLRLAYCDRDGNVYEHPDLLPALRTGRSFVPVHRDDLIPLPYGSVLFSLPDRPPVSYNATEGGFKTMRRGPDGKRAWAASSFLCSGYLRTYLPAFERKENARLLPLWAYCGLAVLDGEFYVPAVRIDEDVRSDPAEHENDDELAGAIEKTRREHPQNRLVNQLSKCSVEYRCLCARNFFLSRHEAPIPTSRACNARCLGCLSQQSDSGFSESQHRIGFEPTPQEIAEVMLHHAERVDAPVMSFGQGCEGEPLLRGEDLAAAIRMVRERSHRGTINLNTNGSKPDMVKRMIDAGLDSIRISFNSTTRSYYERYFRPKGYSYDDVLRSLDVAIESGIFVSINLFFLPGFTDMESEVASLTGFLDRFPVNMIQTRNLNIDPDYYLDNVGYEESPAIGVRNLLALLRQRYPALALGYYNPPRERFRRISDNG